MISMPQIQSIRSRRRNGESIASIARSERVSEPTVRKYLRVDDLSARPPVRRRRGSVIDEWLPMIEGMLAEDRETWRKQRHTATRIHERLRDEYGAGVSLSTVTRTVARLRREAAAEREAGFLDLSWHPGECQADFGQVDVRYRGVVTRMRHFVLDFPYSNIGCFASMFVRQVRQCFSAVWADGFPPVSSSFPGDVRGIGAAACIFPSCQSVLIRPVAAGRRSGRKGTWRYRCPLCKISGDSTGRECRARR